MKFVPNAVSSKIARQVLIGRKHSPAILLGAGVASMVTSTVLACRATLKLDEVLDESSGLVAQIRETQHENYSDHDRTKDLALVRVQTSVKIVRLYSPAIAVGVAGIVALGGSQHILSKRNAGLMAAYAALEKGFDEYRQRVLKDVGEEREHGYRFPKETVTEEVIDSKGHTKTVEKKIVGPNGYSPYARFFDELCVDWQRQPEYNLLFLQCKQNYANDMLQARGHLFLNEVYDMLGLDHSRAGAVVGWVIGDEGDNFVDFGVFDGSNPKARDFVNGREGSILLDFNVDGVIYDKI